MRSFAQKPKASQQSESARSSMPGRAHSGQSLAVSSILHLQHTIGNQAVQRLLKPRTEDLKASSASSASAGLVYDFSRIPVHSSTRSNIQPKLKVNAPEDIYEQEADRTAAQVMNMRDPGTPQPVPREMSPEEKEADVQSKPLAASITPLVQREMMHEVDEEPIQTKLSLPRAGKGGALASNNRLETQLSSKGGGGPLPDEVRTFMEPRFGVDFSQVRVHTDSGAAQMNRVLNAQAFTHRQNIYFGAGKSAGKDALTAHELTHVLQQTGGAQSKAAAHVPGIQREVQVRPPGRGEASAFDRRQELIDRLNGQSPAIQYRLDGRVLRYNVVDEAALTNFDRQMRGFIDRAEVVPMRLITSAGFVGGGPLLVDSLELAYVDLDDLLGSDDLSFQLNLIHVLTERFGVRNYERRIGTNMPEFDRVHRAGLEAEAEHLRSVIGDPTIRFNYEETRPNGTDVFAFRSDEGYRVFHVFRRGAAAERSGDMFVLTRDRRRLTIDQLIAERAAAAPAAPAPALP
jgi:hypothetical protein